MKPTVLLVSAALCGATAIGCSTGPESVASDSFPVDALATLQSQSGAFTVEVRTAPDQPPIRELTSVELRIQDASGAPAEGLTLTVLPWMPEMGHGASITPTVTDEGGGRYVVSDVEWVMPGAWELRTSIAPGQDRATPSFQIP
jgi:hypothetical protein